MIKCNQNRKRLFLYLGIWVAGLMFLSKKAYAIVVPVPLAPGAGYGLVSTTTGQYIYVSSTSTAPYFWASLGANIYNNNSGNVGICNQSPTEALSVTGNIYVVNASGGAAVGKCNTFSACYSSAFGFSNCAEGQYSSTLGYNNFTGNIYSAAVGFENNSNGTEDSIFGFCNTTNSSYCQTAMGYCNTVGGLGSSAFGTHNIVCANNASAFGSCLTNCISNSAMLGASSTPIDNLIVLSSGNVGIGTVNPLSLLEVQGTASVQNINATSTTATSTFFGGVCVNNLLAVTEPTNNAVVIGTTTGNCRGNYALDIQSCRLNGTKVASGNCSAAVELSDTASALYGMAFGKAVTASGNCSSAFGVGSTASGSSTASFGFTDSSTGCFGSALGYCNTSAGVCATSVGNCNAAPGSAATAMGYKNSSCCNTSSAVGALNTTGTTGCESSAFGFCNTTASGYSSAFGACNSATVACSSAFGFKSCAACTPSNAFGFCTCAAAAGASAFGVSVCNSIANSTMIGASCTSTNNLIVLSTGFAGIGTTTPLATLVAQAASGVKPFIVASSTNATDFGVDANDRVVIGTAGVAKLSAGTVTVTPGVPIDSNTLIMLTDQSESTFGSAGVSATTSTQFTITSTNALDASIVAWFILQKTK